MYETKKWYQSLGMWSGITGLVLAVTGIDFTDIATTENIDSIGASVAIIAAMYGRIRAKAKIEG